LKNKLEIIIRSKIIRKNVSFPSDYEFY
jgi:hypothetical protein